MLAKQQYEIIVAVNEDGFEYGIVLTVYKDYIPVDNTHSAVVLTTTGTRYVKPVVVDNLTYLQLTDRVSPYMLGRVDKMELARQLPLPIICSVEQAKITTSAVLQLKRLPSINSKFFVNCSDWLSSQLIGNLN